MLRRIDGLTNCADQSVDVARPYDETNFVIARNVCDFGVVFHHRDKRATSRQDSVDLAWHQASSRSRRERYQVKIGSTQRLAKFFQRLKRQENHIGQTHRARLLLEPVLPRTFADHSKQNSLIIA